MPEVKLQKRINSGKNGPIQPGPIHILFMLGLFLVGVGLWLTLVEARGYERDLQRLSESSLVEAAAFRAAAPGQDVILAGSLGGAAGAGPDSLDDWARGYDLVIYAHQNWVCKRDDRDGLEGAWRWSERVAPQVITLDGTEIPIAQAKIMAMTGARFDSPVVWQANGRFCDGLREGTLRVTGYQAGDPVCLLGQKAAEGYLLLDHVYGGGRDSFMADLEGKASYLWRTGRIVLWIGLLSSLIWAGVVLVPRLLRCDLLLL